MDLLALHCEVISFPILIQVSDTAYDLPVYHDDVVIWAVQVETFPHVNKIDAQFELDIVRSALPASLVRSLRDVITMPNAYRGFEEFKAELLKRNIQLEDN